MKEDDLAPLPLPLRPVAREPPLERGTGEGRERSPPVDTPPLALTLARPEVPPLPPPPPKATSTEPPAPDTEPPTDTTEPPAPPEPAIDWATTPDESVP